MNCIKCNGSYQEKHGALKFNDRYLGIITIDDVDYLECPNCHGQLLPDETAILIGNKRKELLEQYLQARPIKDFLSATETAESLKITRQALHKHKRINNGFIYQTMFNGNKVYLKESIDLYKKNGDGRFLINNWPMKKITIGHHTDADFGIWSQGSFIGINISALHPSQKDKPFLKISTSAEDLGDTDPKTNYPETYLTNTIH